MATKQEQLRPHHDKLVTWAAQGTTLREMAHELNQFGIKTDHSAVYRYLKANRIEIAPKLPLPSMPPSSAPVLSSSVPPAASAYPQGRPDLSTHLVPVPAKASPPNIAPSQFVLPPLEPLPQSRRPPQPKSYSNGQEVRNRPPKPAEAPPKPIPPAAPAPKPEPVSVRFPDLDPHRETVLSGISGGCLPLETWAILSKAYHVPTTQERVAEYTAALLDELYPQGPIQRHLYEIHKPTQVWPETMPFVSYGEGDNKDVFTFGDAYRHTVCFGGPGTGKTTGVGYTMLSHAIGTGCGVLALTVKKGEATRLAQVAAACNRGGDVAIVRVGGPLKMNFLQYESEAPARGSALADNLVAFFRNLVSAVSGERGQSPNEAFWRQTGEQLIRNLILVFRMAGEALSLNGFCQFITYAPLALAAVENDKWRKIPYFGRVLAQAERYAITPTDRDEYTKLEQYWLFSYPTLAPDTRSSITFAFGALIDSLRDRHIYDLVGGQTTITPEAIFNGRIVIVDLPVDEYHEAGRLVQAAWKFAFMRAALRRADHGWGDKTRPVALYEDEFHGHLLDFDPDFQRVAREYRVARIMLTQNINNLYDRFGGGDYARVKVESILGNVATRLYLANGDAATNQYASDSIGTADRVIKNTSTTPQTYPGFDLVTWMMHKLLKKPVTTVSTHTVREPMVHPHEFSLLRPGGPEHGFIAEAIITQVGRTFLNGLPYRRVGFRQTFFPATD